jgi:rod shape-determining protein MreB
MGATHRSWLSSGFGIDLGTVNTVVCHPGRGILLNEPSVMVVMANDSMRPTAVGTAARELIGRTASGVVAIRPIRDGVVADLDAARNFMVAILSKVTRWPWERIRPRAVIGVPAGATALERRALIEAADEAGIGRAHLIPEPIAGALGSGLDPMAPRARMVVDVGGGTAEVTGFCFGDILTTRSSRVAGEEMTLALHQYLRQEHQVAVGELTAEDVKVRMFDGSDSSLIVTGRDAVTGRPRLLTLNADEVSAALRPTSESIVRVLADCLDDIPPQAVGDLMSGGLMAFGGGVFVQGFAKLLEEAFGFPVRIAERPLTCVAEGAAMCLRRPQILRAFGT